MKWNKRC